jgi:hypothetical protein
MDSDKPDVCIWCGKDIATSAKPGDAKADPTCKEEGGMQPMTFGGLPAAASEFSTVRRVGLFAMKMKGIRISAPGGDYGWDVNITAPEKSFDSFALLATKMLASVQLAK